MTQLVSGHDAQIAAWVRSKIPGQPAFGPCVAIGMMDSERRMLGGIVFHSWDAGSRVIWFTLASVRPSWATPGTFHALLSYAFDQAGARKCMALIASDNVKSLKLARRLRLRNGARFKEEAVLRHQFAHKRHGVIFSLMEDEFRRIPVPRLVREAA